VPTGRPVAAWTVEEVATWVLSLRLPVAAVAFRENDITGMELLEMAHDELRDELGVQKVGQLKRLWGAIQELQRAAASGAVVPPDYKAGAISGGAEGEGLARGLLGPGGMEDPSTSPPLSTAEVQEAARVFHRRQQLQPQQQQQQQQRSLDDMRSIAEQYNSLSSSPQDPAGAISTAAAATEQDRPHRWSHSGVGGGDTATRRPRRNVSDSSEEEEEHEEEERDADAAASTDAAASSASLVARARDRWAKLRRSPPRPVGASRHPDGSLLARGLGTEHMMAIAEQFNSLETQAESARNAERDRIMASARNAERMAAQERDSAATWIQARFRGWLSRRMPISTTRIVHTRRGFGVPCHWRPRKPALSLPSGSKGRGLD
jgi:hypothetical protein